MFAWISRQVYAAFIGGAFRAANDMGMIESDAETPEQQAAAVRDAIAAPEAIADGPKKGRKS